MWSRYWTTAQAAANRLHQGSASSRKLSVVCPPTFGSSAVVPLQAPAVGLLAATPRLIGAVTPIQMETKVDCCSLLSASGVSLIRCSNSKCLNSRVTHSTPTCAGCGSRMETITGANLVAPDALSKAHSQPLTPLDKECMSRQSSNDSAPAACS